VYFNLGPLQDVYNCPRSVSRCAHLVHTRDLNKMTELFWQAFGELT
jgi:hypothetical protein